MISLKLPLPAFGQGINEPMKLSIFEIIKQAPEELLDKKYSTFFQRRLLCTFKHRGRTLFAPPIVFS